MNKEQLMSEVLCLPTTAIAYQMSQRLVALFPGKALIEGDTSLFDIEDYAKAKFCTIEPKGYLYNQAESYWNSVEIGISENVRNGWFEVRWQGYAFDVLIMHWDCEFHFWIIGEIKEITETFFAAVCEWNLEVSGEVLVFDNGYWYKDENLFKAIKGATFDNLVLNGELKQTLSEDLSHFFTSRAVYDQYKIPWKRGILLVGPPGNGKTHAIKALINSLGRACLYVKSFKTQDDTEESNIRRVFERARKSTPCILVFEDLDALVTVQNRSFFLNELDGFANNSGILALATTNHPEKLDPAIVDRPSRFDRKYHFDLPGPNERLAYLELWNNTLQPSLQLSEAGVKQLVEVTEGFSFAYLKELFLSSMMGWVAKQQVGAMEQVMSEQVVSLREQMVSANTAEAKDKE